jgi:AraC-like DNA-binding protein
MNKRDLPISYAAVLVDVACEFGASRQELMNAAGLQREILKQPEAPYTAEDFRQLMTIATAMTGKKSLALHVGQQLILTSTGILAYALLSCHNLHQALEILTKYYRLLLHNNALIARTEDQRVIIESHLTREPLLDRRQDTELFFSGVISAIKHLLNVDQVPADIELSYSPPTVDKNEHQDEDHPYQALLGESVKFNQKISRVVFPASLMNEKPVYTDPTMLKHYEQQCAELLSRMPASDGLRAKMQQYLVSAKQHFPSLEQAADHFHMSPRTFRRRLSDEGVSFQKILDEVRLQLAETYLRCPALSVNHTADLLGFHDVSNFRRAFIRWSHGVSPSAFKKQQFQQATSS